MLKNSERFSKYVFFDVVDRDDVTAIVFHALNGSPDERDACRNQLHMMLEQPYRKIIQFDFRQLHFHFPDSTSFLRMHAPYKYGDSLRGVRVSVDRANAEKQIVTGFEEGRIFNGFRYVFPLSYNETHIGTVEVSASPAAVLASIYDLYPNLGACFLIREDVVRQKVF